MENLDLLEKIGAVSATVLTVGTFIYKKIILKYFEKKKERLKRQQDIWSKIDKIEKEITPNGGGSIKDKINATCLMVTQIKEMAEKVAGKQMTDYYASKTPMFEVNKLGQCIWVNHAYSHVTGRGFEELQGEGWRICIAEEDAERVFINWAHCIKDNRDFHDKYHFRKPNGSLVEVECDAHRIKNSIGEVMGWLGYLKVVHNEVPFSYGGN